jgi:hypothetical protein
LRALFADTANSEGKLSFLRTIQRIAGLAEHVRFSAVLPASSEFLQRMATDANPAMQDVLGWARNQTERCRSLKAQLTLADLQTMLADPANRVPALWEREPPPPRYLLASDRLQIAWVLTSEYILGVLKVEFESQE